MFAFWRCLRFGALLLAPLQSAVCRVLLQGAAVRVLCALWGLVAGSAAGQGATTRCCCQSAVGAWLLVQLQGLVAGCLC